MIEVGRLTRDLGASAARAIEDELDWEHLPHVHSSTFSAVERVHSADRMGWEADVVLADGTSLRMRVTLDEDRMGYTNATFSGGIENGRAVARLEATGSNSCRMSLRFFVPETPGVDVAASGAFYVTLFNRLIDEDEPKMIYRAAALKAGAAPHRERRLVLLADGSQHEVPLVCPHQGLPLNAEPDAEGIIQCPWHGYRFDARTGACISGQVSGWR